MPYLYNIGYGSCEESCYIQLWHKDKFTVEQLEDLYFQAAKKIILSDDKIGFIDICDEEYIVSFQDLNDIVLDLFVKEYGFEAVEFQARLNYFGWVNIFNSKSWKDYADESDIRFKERVKNDPELQTKYQELFKRALEENKKDEKL